MTDPVMTAVAVALVTKAVDGLTEGGRAAFAALAKLVRRKLAANNQAPTTIDGTDEQALSDALSEAAARDRTFAEELHRLWQAVHEARNDAVRNVISGDVSGNVVQGRDIHGGVSFGRP